MTGADVLTKSREYDGEEISIKSLEASLSGERDRQNVDLDKLKSLRSRNTELSKSLADEIKRLRRFSDFFSQGGAGSFLANLKEIMSYIPGLGKLFITKRSIEELLKQQYQISSTRTREVANYADRLQAAEQDLYREIERLNEKIIEHAKNEETAVENVLDLKGFVEAREKEIAETENKSSKSYRELEAGLDKAMEQLSEHSAKLELYSSAEERLAKLKENTRRLQQTITNLHSDIKKYVLIATEKLDEAQAHIQAIGTAADASVVLLDMKSSLDSMTNSVNETTRFVSETQMYLRENLDSLINDLELYDEQTQALVKTNLERSKKIEDEYLQKAVEKALKYKEQRNSAIS